MIDMAAPVRGAVGVAWALLLALAWPAAQASTVTLAQAAEAVLANNPELAASQARVQQAAAGVRQADGARLPRVTLSLTATHTNDALAAFGLRLGQERVTAADFAPAALNDPDGINNLNTRIEVQAPLYTGGQVRARQHQARAGVRTAEQDDDATRQQLLLATVRAYQGVHLARADLQVARQSQIAAQEYLRVAELLHRQGMAVRSDRLSAQVNLDNARLRVSEAQRHEAHALDRLRQLMGLALTEPLDVGAEAVLELPSGTDAELHAEASQRHPALNALRSQLDGASAAVTAARGANRPQINVLARQDWNDRALGLDAPSYTLAGVLSWHAFDGGSNTAALARAQAVRQELAARLRQAEAALAVQIAEARRRALEAEERITVRTGALADAEEAMRLTQLRYQNGLTTQVDLFTTQAQLDQARAELAQARHDRSVARAEVLAAAGLLTHSSLSGSASPRASAGCTERSCP